MALNMVHGHPTMDAIHDIHGSNMNINERLYKYHQILLQILQMVQDLMDFNGL